MHLLCFSEKEEMSKIFGISKKTLSALNLLKINSYIDAIYSIHGLMS